MPVPSSNDTNIDTDTPSPDVTFSAASSDNPISGSPARSSAAEQEEARLIRRMQLMMNLVLQTIAQDHALTVDDAARMIGDARAATLAMFPGKELAYDLIWRPRFQRLMRERFRIM